MAHTILFIGPQGSGKGTQVAAVANYLRAHDSVSVEQIETGTPFRELAERGGFAAALVKELIEHGQFVPNVITNALVMQELVDRLTPECHVLLDGYPRDLDQAHTLEAALTFFKRPRLTVFHLDTPDEVVIARMKGRGRSDDTDVAIAERLRLYHTATEPLVAYYRSRPETTFVTVNGAESIESVTRQLVATLQ